MNNYKDNKKDILVKKNILSVGMTDARSMDILEYVINHIQKKKDKLEIFTPNPEIIIYGYHHPDFQNVLNQAQVSLIDGIGVILAGKILGQSLTSRTSGVDFMLMVCQRSVELRLKIGLLGAKSGVAQRARKCLERAYPGINIPFAQSEFDNEKEKMPELDILFVAYGFPKQEEWITSHLPKLPTQAAMSVGGALDYISGDIPRAPIMVRKLGLEWLYRLIVQPWRWKRQLSLIVFLVLVLRERLK